MPEIIDLSQEIYSGMAVFSGMPQVKVSVHATHEEWEGITGSEVVSPAVNRLEMGEHTGTHVDALSHMGGEYRGQSIDSMPLSMFYTAGICLDLSHKGPGELIEVGRPQGALRIADISILPGDTVLLYTDHYRQDVWDASLGKRTRVERGGGALAGGTEDRRFRRGDGGAGGAQGVEQGGAPRLRGGGLYPLREPGQPAPAGG